MSVQKTEHKLTTEEALAYSKIESWVKARVSEKPSPFTLQDAIAASGIEAAILEPVLSNLIARYSCRLQVTENGELIFDFDAPLKRLNQKPLEDYAKEILSFLWKGFQLFFKAWIALTLVVYFSLFVVILIAIILGLAFSGDNKKNKNSLDVSALGKVFDVFFSIFRFSTVISNTTRATDQFGYDYKKFKPKPSVLNENKKGFVASVYDFVFGPPRVEKDILSDEKEVLAFLRENAGVISQTEVMALSGRDQKSAAHFFARCAGKFGGIIKVSENGSIYAVYDEVLIGKDAAETKSIEYYWDEYEPKFEFSSNTVGRDMLIGAMNFFNLAMSLFMLNLIWELPSPSIQIIINAFKANDLNDPFIWFFSFAPFIFSFLFFIIPFIRAFWIIKMNQKLHEINIRKRFWKSAFVTKGSPKSLKEFEGLVNANSKEEKITGSIFNLYFEKLKTELGFEMTADSDGTYRVSFPQLHLELNDVQALREKRNLAPKLGKVILDTGKSN
ncbi:MAG: hypothetical protein SFU91_09335 [Chloroherpetonaceae bacterium]|nr:hypothetical protein [Chloroherpetonaceae bacterium]